MSHREYPIREIDILSASASRSCVLCYDAARSPLPVVGSVDGEGMSIVAADRDR